MRGPFQYCGYCGNSFAARLAPLREDGCLECASCSGIMPQWARIQVRRYWFRWRCSRTIAVFCSGADGTVPAHAVPPESLEAGWFSEGECRALDSWEPASSIDIGIQFNFFRTPTFGIIQNTVGFLRLISADGIRYL